jgi:hypothetical protein
VAPIAVTQYTQGTLQEPGEDAHPWDAHHNQSIPHPNVSDFAHELYNTFEAHHDNEDVCSRLCKKSIVFPASCSMAALTLIHHLQHSLRMRGLMMAVMSSWSERGVTLPTPSVVAGGPPAKAYNTNPNLHLKPQKYGMDSNVPCH